MNESASEKRNILLGLISGPLILAGYIVTIIFLSDRKFGFSDEWAFLLFQIVWISIPFYALMLYNPTSYEPWIVSFLLTCSVYAYSIIDAIGRPGGANIGMGLILAASPFVITGVSLGVASSQKLRRRNSE